MDTKPWQEVPTLARDVIKGVREMLGEGIMSDAGLVEVAKRAIRAGERRHTSAEHKIYSEEELRAVCNDASPHDAFMLVLSFAQRITIALENIAGQVEDEAKSLLDAPKDTSS